MKKIIPLKVFTILALFALLGSNAQAMAIKNFLGISRSSKEAPDERLSRKIDDFSRAQAAARSGEGSPHLRDDRALELKRELSKTKDLKPEHIEALKNLHQEHLPQGKEQLSSAHQPYSVRKAIEKIVPELRDARLGTPPAEAGATRAAASTSRRSIVEEKEQSTTQVEQQDRKPLNTSDPVKVVRKSSVQVKEIETVLKNAQSDLRTAEKAAEKARNAHMAYEDKLRKDYPAESEILNKRDFEKARIAEITKNLEGDSAQTRSKLQSKYDKAIASGNAENASTLKARLKNADEKILEQKKEVATRQSQLNTYDKMIAQVVDQATIDKFNAAEGLKANRLAAEEQKTKLGLEVNTIRGALQEAKNPTVLQKLDSTEQKQPAMQSDGQPTLIKPVPIQSAMPLPPVSSSQAAAPTTQEEIERKLDWKKIPAPVNIQREIDIKTLKDKQATLPEDSIIERAKIDKEIAAKKFESSVAKGFEAAQKGDIIAYAKALSNEQKQLKKEVDAEDVIRKEQNRKLLDKEPEAKNPTVVQKLDSTKKSVGTDNQQEASTSPTPVRGNDRTGVPLPTQLDEEKKLTQLKPEQPAALKGTEEKSPQSSAKVERPITIYPDLKGPEVYSKSFVPGGLRAPSDKEQEKGLEKLRAQEQSRIAAEPLPGTPKPASTMREKLDSTEKKQPAMQSDGQPTLIKILPTNKQSSNVAIAQEPEAPKPTVGGASGPERRASGQIETISPPPLPREITKVPSTSSEAPKPELIPASLAQQIQAEKILKPVDRVAVELEKKAAQEKNDTARNVVAEVVKERREAVAPSKANKAKAKAEEEAFWATT